MTTTKTNLTQPAIGAPNWGPVLNANFASIDKSFQPYSSVNVTARNTNLTTDQCGYGFISVFGNCASFTYTSSEPYNTITIPAGIQGYWFFYNAISQTPYASTNTYRLTVVKYPGQLSVNGVVIPIGTITLVYGDGTTAQYGDIGSATAQLVPIGTIQLAGSSSGGQFFPTYGWVNCDGTSYSTTAYPVAFAVLKYQYGGSGSTFKVPNIPNLTVTTPSGTAQIPYVIKIN